MIHIKDYALQIIIFAKEKEPNLNIKKVIAILRKVFLKIRNVTYVLIEKKKKEKNDYKSPNLRSQTMQIGIIY